MDDVDRIIYQHELSERGFTLTANANDGQSEAWESTIGNAHLLLIVRNFSQASRQQLANLYNKGVIGDVARCIERGTPVIPQSLIDKSGPGVDIGFVKGDIVVEAEGLSLTVAYT